MVPIAGDCKPQDETLDVEWVDPKSDVMDTFVAQMVNGHGRIVRQALAWAESDSCFAFRWRGWRVATEGGPL
ncbi:MAG: DUF4916 domain-containing protein [Bifidobacterium dentium]